MILYLLGSVCVCVCICLAGPLGAREVGRGVFSQNNGIEASKDVSGILMEILESFVHSSNGRARAFRRHALRKSERMRVRLASRETV